MENFEDESQEAPGCPIETDSLQFWPVNQVDKDGKPLGRRPGEQPIQRIGINYGDENYTS